MYSRPTRAWCIVGVRSKGKRENGRKKKTRYK